MPAQRLIPCPICFGLGDASDGAADPQRQRAQVLSALLGQLTSLAQRAARC